MTTVLLDTHALLWWAVEPGRLSRTAARVIEEAAELAVAAITWFELAWLAENGRITSGGPMRAWLDELAADVRTVGITPAIASTAASLPTTFPGDPADRLIFATAVEHGWQLVTKDRRLRAQRRPRAVAVW